MAKINKLDKRNRSALESIGSEKQSTLVIYRRTKRKTFCLEVLARRHKCRFSEEGAKQELGKQTQRLIESEKARRPQLHVRNALIRDILVFEIRNFTSKKPDNKACSEAARQTFPENARR